MNRNSTRANNPPSKYTVTTLFTDWTNARNSYDTLAQARAEYDNAGDDIVMTEIALGDELIAFKTGSPLSTSH